MTCLECGAVVQEHFKPKPLTKAQVKARQEYAREISESIKSLTGRSAKDRVVCYMDSQTTF